MPQDRSVRTRIYTTCGLVRDRDLHAARTSHWRGQRLRGVPTLGGAEPSTRGAVVPAECQPCTTRRQSAQRTDVHTVDPLAAYMREMLGSTPQASPHVPAGSARPSACFVSRRVLVAVQNASTVGAAMGTHTRDSSAHSLLTPTAILCCVRRRYSFHSRTVALESLPGTARSMRGKVFAAADVGRRASKDWRSHRN
jgi:hypothetical protein